MIVPLPRDTKYVDICDIIMGKRGREEWEGMGLESSITAAADIESCKFVS